MKKRIARENEIGEIEKEIKEQRWKNDERKMRITGGDEKSVEMKRGVEGKKKRRGKGEEKWEWEWEWEGE